MRPHHLLLISSVIGLLVAPALVAAEGAESGSLDGPRICLIANAGFFVTDGEKSLLLDAVLAEGLRGYAIPSPALEEAMETGAEPFGNVVLVFSSHMHGDHFNARATLRHMAANPDARYLLTPQSVSVMEREGLEPPARDRITAEMPPETGALDYEIGGIKLRTYRISHGSDRMQNLGIYFELGGKRFFHPGDISTDAEALKTAGLDGLEVDYLLAPFWSLMGDGQQTALEAGFKAAHVIPMHLPMGEASWMKEYGGYKGVLKTVFAALPGTISLTNEMTCSGF